MPTPKAPQSTICANPESRPLTRGQKVERAVEGGGGDLYAQVG